MLSKEFITEWFDHEGKPTTWKTLTFGAFTLIIDKHFKRQLHRYPPKEGIRDLEYNETVPSIKRFPELKYKLKARDVGQFWIYDPHADIGFGMDKGMDDPKTGRMTLYLNTVLGGSPHTEGKKDIINLS